MMQDSAPTNPNVSPIRVDSFWMPEKSSTIAGEIDYGFYVIYYVSIVFFVLVVGAMLYFMWKYRRQKEGQKTSPIDHNFKLEVAWSVIPTVLLIWFFAIGLKGYANATVAPGDALEINVTAKMYGWEFQYPDGTIVPGELGVPVNKPVKLTMSSRDVLHSFYIAEFRVKQDVVPGLYTTLWFEATQEGRTPFQCTEYCGTGHSKMMGDVVVMSEESFAKWMESGGMGDLPPAELGEKLYVRNGCNTCHSLDGSKLTGPSFKGLFGRESILSDGSKVVVDENYIRQSIYDPQSQIVQGYPASMPTFKGVIKENHLNAIIAFMKEQK